ncbi:MAG: hypothetical protein H0T42_31450 [Deltaproteobacteria bacterium]|nr:hypothetical protein [Deltaproteobacteria bacterium]
MNEKARIGVIFGAVALVLGGGLFYFFKIHQPKQQQGAAQGEVLAWEERWNAARECLLGKQPASSSSRESLAVREMQPEPWERKTCTQLIGKLSRGVAEDTGLMKVEHAWMTTDRAAGKFANAFAMHADPFGDAAMKAEKESALGAAFESLDAAHAELRAAAGLDATAVAQLPSLPAAEIIPIKDGAERVTSLVSWVLPSAGGIYAHGGNKTSQFQIVAAPGQAPRALKVPNGALRAVPDLSWAASGLFSEVAIAPIDERGAFGTITNLPITEPGRVFFAVGSLTAGMVAYKTGDHLTVARATGGPFAADTPLEMERTIVAVDPAGRVLLAWNPFSTPENENETARLRGFITRGDAPPKIVELGTGYAGSACLTATQGWVGDSSQAISFSDTGAVPHLFPRHDLLGCTKDSALLHNNGTSHYVVCTEACRAVNMGSIKSTHVATVAGDKVQAIRARGGVLGVWRENALPVFYATQSTLQPMLATSDGKVIDVLATTDDGLVIARVPVK